jgi:hypothetical protein
MRPNCIDIAIIKFAESVNRLSRNLPVERNKRKGRFSGPERTYMLGTVLIVLLILMLIGAFPTWPHSRSWGYYPSGGLGLVLVILVVLLLLDRI